MVSFIRGSTDQQDLILSWTLHYSLRHRLGLINCLSFVCFELSFTWHELKFKVPWIEKAYGHWFVEGFGAAWILGISKCAGRALTDLSAVLWQPYNLPRCLRWSSTQLHHQGLRLTPTVSSLGPGVFLNFLRKAFGKTMARCFSLSVHMDRKNSWPNGQQYSYLSYKW